MPDNEIYLDKLTGADYTFGSDVEVTGSQNVFFDHLKSTIKVDTMFNSTPTTFNCKTLRVWVPDSINNGRDINGYYYIQDYPSDESKLFNQGGNVNIDDEIPGHIYGSTINFRSYSWKKTEGTQYTITANGLRWMIIDANGSTVSITTNSYTIPLSGNYSNITGTTIFPLVVWSDKDEPVPVHRLSTFTLAIEGTTASDGSDVSRSYGFTPYMFEGTECVVKWGDGTTNTYNDSCSGKLIIHNYDSDPVADPNHNNTRAYLVEIDAYVYGIKFGLNRDYYDITKGNEATDGVISGTTVSYPEVYNSTGQSNYYTRNKLTWQKINNRGNWISGSNYSKNDFVFSYNNYYVCKNTLTRSTIEPSSDETNWQRITYTGYNNMIFPKVGYGNAYTINDFCDYINPNTSVTEYYLCVLDNFYHASLSNRVLNCTFTGEGVAEITVSYCMFNECTYLDTETITRKLQSNNSASGESIIFNQWTSLPDNIENGDYTFTTCSSAKFNGIETIASGCTSGYAMFYNCESAQFNKLSAINSKILANDNKLVNGEYMFSYSGANSNNPFPLLSRLPSSLKYANYMFYASYGLESLNLGNCTESDFNGSSMFLGCQSEFTSLTTLPPNLKYAYQMFSGCNQALFNGLTSLPNTLIEATDMFGNCGLDKSEAGFTNLTSLGSSLKYAGFMFMDSMASLVKINNLPSTLMTMFGMFRNCHELIFGSNNLFSSTNLSSIVNKLYTDLRYIGISNDPTGLEGTFQYDDNLTWNQTRFYDAVGRTSPGNTQVDFWNTFDSSSAPLTNTYIKITKSSKVSVTYPYVGNYTYAGDDKWTHSSGNYYLDMYHEEIRRTSDDAVLAEYEQNSGWKDISVSQYNPWSIVCTMLDEWTYRGNYDKTIWYRYNDVVYYNNKLLVNKIDHNAGINGNGWTPISNTIYNNDLSSIEAAINNPVQFNYNTNYSNGSIVKYQTNFYKYNNSTSGIKHLPEADLLVRYVSSLS